jgi:protein-disulfide isomerase
LSTKTSNRELLVKKRKEEKRRKTITFTLIALGAVLLISLIIIIPNLITGRSKADSGRGFPLGDPNAPVSVINFSSYACGHCERFSTNVEPDFIASYVDTGDVYYRYLTVASPRNPTAVNAAIASYCAADQERFFDFKPYLYPAAGIQDGFSTTNLINLAETAGLDKASFEACLTGQTHQNAPSEDFRFAQSVGVTSTPTFLVNGQLVFANELIPLVESLLNE